MSKSDAEYRETVLEFHRRSLLLDVFPAFQRT
jgi:hypothetical protein